MAKLDARNWMEFRIGDIFRMNNTKSIVQKDVVPDSGTVPYVTAQAGNNGVMTFIDCPPEWMDEGDCIMIGGKTLTFPIRRKLFVQTTAITSHCISRKRIKHPRHAIYF